MNLWRSGLLMAALLTLPLAASVANPSPTWDHNFGTVPNNNGVGSTQCNINWLSVSGDGQRTLVGTCIYKPTANVNDDTVYKVQCLNADGGVLWTSNTPKIYQGIYWTALSRDGRVGAAGGNGRNHMAFLRLFDMANGFVIYEESYAKTTVKGQMPGRVNAIAASSNGEWVVVASGDSDKHAQLRLIHTHQNYQGGIPVGHPTVDPNADVFVPNPNPFSNNITCLDMSQDGKWIVAGSSVGNVPYVWVFQNQNGALVLQEKMSGPTTGYADNTAFHEVKAVSMSDDGKVFAASFSNSQFYVWNWNIYYPGDTRPMWMATEDGVGLDHVVYGIKVSPDGRLVASATNKDFAHGVVSLWNVGATWTMTMQKASTRACWSLIVDGSPNPGVSIDRRNEWVAVATGYDTPSHPNLPGYFYLIGAGNGTVNTAYTEWKMSTTLMNWPIAISYDGQHCVGGSDNGHAWHWSLFEDM